MLTQKINKRFLQKGFGSSEVEGTIFHVIKSLFFWFEFFPFCPIFYITFKEWGHVPNQRPLREKSTRSLWWPLRGLSPPREQKPEDATAIIEDAIDKDGATIKDKAAAIEDRIEGEAAIAIEDEAANNMEV